MAKSNKRRITGEQSEDCHKISNIEYNSYAGGQKNLAIGPALEYIGTLDAVKVIPAGVQLYVFNPTAGILYVTLDEDSTATPTAGTAPAANTFPAFAASYTPIAADAYRVIIGQAGLHLYKLKDDSKYRVDID